MEYNQTVGDQQELMHASRGTKRETVEPIEIYIGN